MVSDTPRLPDAVYGSSPLVVLAASANCALWIRKLRQCGCAAALGLVHR